MGKQSKEELPLMTDFTEDSLLMQVKDDDVEDIDDEHDEKDDLEDEDEESLKKKEKKKSSKKKEEVVDEVDEIDEEDKDEDEDEDEEKKTKKKKSVSKKDDDDEDEDEEETENFWSDVEKLTGRQVEVDYKETDPESAEGAALREEALAQQVINDHLAYLSKVYPREFKALEHAANGGKIEDLYNPSEPDYSQMKIEEKDEEAQKAFLMSYYQKKGFSPSRSKRLIETDEDSDEGLFKTSEEALKEMTANQEKDRNKQIEQQEKTSKQNKKEDLQMIGSVEQIIETGKLNKFTIPVKEREEFYQFALSQMQRNPNGGYMFVTPVENRKLEQQLQELFFAYKRGDLSSIIQREVKTEGARKLKRNVGKQKKVAGTIDEKKSKRSLPIMDDYNE